MLCEKCGKNPATTYVKKTVNGKTTELRLCSACASEQGIGTMWNDFGFDLGNFWGSLFAEPSARVLADAVRCEGCGKTFRELAQSGKAGCPTCYTTFYDRLLPSIQRIHGKSQHMGKVPCGASENAKKEHELDALKQQLADSIARQEYEACAGLRDQIQALEKSLKEGKDHE